MRTQSDSTARNLCLFALPMLIGNVLQSCYNMVDMAVVGRYVGRDALAAVSNTSMLCFISNALCIGFTIGGNVMVARFRGAGKNDDQHETIHILFALSALGGLLLTALNYALYRPLLDLMHVPAAALPFAREYMDIVCAGNVFVFGYNAVCSVMRGLGDSRRPLLFVAVAAAVNIILDYLLVGGFGWGVRGAAAATVFAQAASCLAAFIALARMGGESGSVACRFELRRFFRFSPEKGRELLRLGLPTALHTAALNVSYMIVTALFNRYGIAAAAAAGIGLKINTFVAMPCWAMGQAVTTMAGYGMGAGKPDLAARVARVGVASGLVFCGCLLLLIHLFVRPFIGFFSPDPEVVALGVLYLRICCSANFIPYVVMFILDSFAVGVGSPFFAMANSLLQSVVIRLGLSFLLTMWMEDGFVGLCIAESASPLLPCLFAIALFLHGRWRG